MTIVSNARAVGNVTFPEFTGTRVYMQPGVAGERPVGVSDVYADLVEKMLHQAGVANGTKYFITVDEKVLTAGKKLRRGGAHIDGNFLFSWGGGGWLNGVPGRILTPEQHRLQYQSDLGGTILASNYVACEGFLGTVDGIAGQGGDCEHLRDRFDQLESFWLKENTVYLGNSTFIHEGHPVRDNVNRQLLRITLDTTFKYTQ